MNCRKSPTNDLDIFRLRDFAVFAGLVFHLCYVFAFQLLLYFDIVKVVSGAGV